MNDFGKEFSIIHRYSRVYMSKLLMEYNIPGRAVPYFMEICAHPGISQEQIAKNLKIDKGAVARIVKAMLDAGDSRAQALILTTREDISFTLRKK